MPPGFFEQWRDERRLRRNAVTFESELRAEPDEVDVEWLAKLATIGDLDRARWELRYARRAIGLLVAQRDALDDRTGAAVSHQVTASLAADPRIGAGRARLVERQFNERLSRFRDALVARSGTQSTTIRLGRMLLVVAGATGALEEAAVVRASELVARYSADAQVALRRIFGTAELADDVPPSAQLPGRR